MIFINLQAVALCNQLCNQPCRFLLGIIVPHFPLSIQLYSNTIVQCAVLEPFLIFTSEVGNYNNLSVSCSKHEHLHIKGLV